MVFFENSGFFPTFTSNQAKSKKAARPVRVEIDLPEGATFVQGKNRSEVGHLEGRSNKTAAFGFGASSTDHRGRLEWVVAAGAGTTADIRILSDRAGSIHTTIELA